MPEPVPADVDRLREELADLRALFEVQWGRMAEATDRWRAEDPEARALTMPDLGNLLRWLMDHDDRILTKYVTEHDAHTSTMFERDQLAEALRASEARVADLEAERRYCGHDLEAFERHGEQVAALVAERDRYRQHSITLNSIAFRAAQALGRVPGGADHVTGDPAELVDALIVAHTAPEVDS